MTLLDDRPDLAEPTGEWISQQTVKRSVGSWRLAARLARREVRHRWGRTIIVVLLIAVPVAGMAIGDMSYRADRGTFDNGRALGAADARLDFGDISTPTGTDFEPLVAPVLPPDTTALWFERTGLLLRRDGGTGQTAMAMVTDLDLRSPLAKGMLGPLTGRIPQQPDEVLLSATVAKQFGVGLGDTLTLVRPAQSFEVVGIADQRNDGWNSLDLATPGFDFSVLRVGYVSQTVLLAGPEWKDHPQQTATAVRRAADLLSPDNRGYDPAMTAAGVGYASLLVPMTFSTDPVDSNLAIGWLYGVLAMGVLGVIVAAAFAVSGPRQLVSIGQLSAQGASASTIRRFLGLQGTVSGILGAGLGLAAGLAVFRATASDRQLGRESLSVRDLLIIGLTAMVIATVAALLPSRSLTRISVLTALGGRRPAGRVPRRMVPLGLLSLTAGLAGIVLAVSHRDGSRTSNVVVASLAAALTLGGICCLCPPIVVRVASVVSRRPGSARLAARSLVRHRARSAALLASIISVGAAGAALATYGEHTIDVYNRIPPGLPHNVIALSSNPISAADGEPAIDPSADPTLADPQARQHLEDVVGPVAWIPTRVAMNAAAFIAANYPDPVINADTGQVGQYSAQDYSNRPFALINTTDSLLIDTVAFVASDDLLDLLQVGTAGRVALRETGALFYYTGQTGSIPSTGVAAKDVTPAIVLDGGDPIAIPVVLQTERNLGRNYFIVTTDLADAFRLDVVGGQTFAVAERAITDQDTRQLYDSDLLARSQEAQQFSDLPVVDRALSFDPPSTRGANRGNLYRIGVSASALLLVLLVVTFGLALWAAEGREEQQMLSAIGASPRTLTRLTAWRALILTAVGMLIAVPLGYGTAWLIAVTGTGTAGDAPFPWLVAGSLLIAVPLIVAGLSYAGSTLARLRVKSTG